MVRRCGALESLVMFAGCYRGRRILVTGHTGFKGSWLSEWLLDLGAQVSGFSKDDTEQPIYRQLGLAGRLSSHLGEISDRHALDAVMAEARPEIIFHLAAQPLVRRSYQDPLATWQANVMGTATLLEAVRTHEHVRACVVVTSDKCYENREQIWGYRETDALGGHDPYSASKGAAELVVASWRQSFFGKMDTCRLASARAGNVIGGGDQAEDRLVVDFVRAMRAGVPLRIRRPRATRPWQHVLEPLSGYLWLGARLLNEGREWAEAWNFGPDHDGMVDVESLARNLVAAWGSGSVQVDADGGPHEAGLLHLDCSKARTRLGWRGIWDVARTVHETVKWYRDVDGGADAKVCTRDQITAYAADAQAKGLAWIR